MARKRREAPDPEIRRKVLSAIRRDLERDLKNAPQALETLNAYEAGLLQARREHPKLRPIERELLLAYFSRLKRYNFPQTLQADAVGAGLSVEAMRERNLLWTEIWELTGLLWGAEAGLHRRKLVDRVLNNEFWKDLFESGVSERDAIPALESLTPRAVGRPVTKRPLAVEALQLRMTKLSWGRITRKICKCGKVVNGKPAHDLACQDRLQNEIKSVTSILAKYGIPIPAPRG